ncbi:hypothetical protein EN836_01765 [Mesorhizobium sp. M1C.F.Ca.ET.193.01.1.1]|nr:hypothetical protein EN853_01760 [Mesorhizobium sp. M1C.F.Ca.ET.210.01.1.1]TGQ76116.1 hypothetical protein EN855_001765 [Mesorhizobium sp. M1C.F.Ca.ET.212.01.1.1]TGR14502.1 hypothetical protein EN847_01765 [Mesorhizobium sp. M1C.F.Ca.ET.204.01.1.1]TGR35665.1 hypothetical protein EN839_01765 [Mesorhizobium sp. M1C.F.Ca.ET.196.01.1.1]TGR57935.1 hypothetical protein EN838_01765 [Mesorhizobium sp. M1C.F.Ca.ET.195.01.1.1]TGR70649.1 hypothetical protein EN835_001760 [Mesorhizobium sp. M1C.F.Ca.ET
MMPKSGNRFSDDFLFDLEPDSDFRSIRPEIIRLWRYSMAIRGFKPSNLRSHGARNARSRAAELPGECGQSRSARTFRIWYSSSRMRRQIVNGLGMAASCSCDP